MDSREQNQMHGTVLPEIRTRGPYRWGPTGGGCEKQKVCEATALNGACLGPCRRDPQRSEIQVSICPQLFQQEEQQAEAFTQFVIWTGLLFESVHVCKRRFQELRFRVASTASPIAQWWTQCDATSERTAAWMHTCMYT